jgi:hypothetical protein
VIQIDIKLTINNKGDIQEVSNLCEGKIKLESNRRGSSAKLTFSLVENEILNYHEGNEVVLTVDGIVMFKGYVFKKSRDKNQIIETSCYDQLIYLKLNKETYVYEDMTATKVIQMIASDFKLNVGQIADTNYKIPLRSEDIQTLIDIIYTALDLTLINTGELFVLYDKAGSITLTNIEDMRVNKVISSENTLIDYSYTTDIENSTHNKIKLVRDNEETGRRDVFIEKDSSNMERFGILQLHQKVSENLTEGQVIDLVKRKLALSNRVKRTLSLTDLNGDTSIRAGNSILAHIPNLGDINLNSWLIVDKCTHSIENGKHTMALQLVGEM